jgi:hypothetical protein
VAVLAVICMTEVVEKEQLKEVLASAIIEKIQKSEPVEYDHVMVRGDLDVSKLDLPKENEKILINSAIKIINSKIKGAVVFRNIRFREQIIFINTCFHSESWRNTDFSGSQFCGGADFNATTFFDTRYLVNFRNAKFNRNANFGNVLFSGGADFSNAKFTNANFSNTTFKDDGIREFFSDDWFLRDIIPRCAVFRNATFNWGADFSNAKFNENADFSNAKFNGNVFFWHAKFNRNANFDNSLFNGNSDYSEATFNWSAAFNDITFNGRILFENTTFNEIAFFNNTTFNEWADFLLTKFEGDFLTFENAAFAFPTSQETACRKAKNVLEKNGDREKAGYYFYREMEGKSKQKRSSYRYFDYEALLFCNEAYVAPRELTDLLKYLKYNILEYFFIQVVFGYGVHPWRLITWWGIMIVTFAGLYWVGSGINGASQLFDYIKFSLATAIAPGYIATIISPGSTGYRLTSEYQAVAILESIFGTFLWAGFIATFAKKYMR